MNYNLENLFQDFETELKEIYDEYELEDDVIQKIKWAVSECFDNEQISPSDFISIMTYICSSTSATEKNGDEVKFTYNDMLKRVLYAKRIYIDEDPESLYDEYDYSDNNHI